MHSKQNTQFQTAEKGHFIKLFPELAPLVLPDKELRRLAKLMVCASPEEQKPSKVISNGLSIFGQFLAHDITFESSSKLKAPNQAISQFQNDRTINLDLDCLYGQKTQSFYYNRKDKDKLLLGQKYKLNELYWYDLQRNKQSQAIIPDSRNDENIIVSRMHVLFIRFHNKMVDWVRAQGVKKEVFKEARKMVLWHYHWLILHEYLYKIMDWSVFDRILEEGCRYYTSPNALPLEFTGAVFRLGHSQSREHNRINKITEKKLMELGFFTKMEEYVDWQYLFNHKDGNCQFANLIDARISPSFNKLPFLANMEEQSLPYLNLKRGQTYQLASGEAIAQQLGFEPISIEETKHLSGTPLWYYILKEAAVLGHYGEHLGPVGSTILGECFYTIMQSDEASYLKIYPLWKPNVSENQEGFDFVEMIEFIQI